MINMKLIVTPIPAIVIPNAQHEVKLKFKSLCRFQVLTLFMTAYPIGSIGMFCSQQRENI